MQAFQAPCGMQISIVSQEPVLFADTIFYNIAFGVRDMDSVSLAQVNCTPLTDRMIVCQSI